MAIQDKGGDHLVGEECAEDPDEDGQDDDFFAQVAGFGGWIDGFFQGGEPWAEDFLDEKVVAEYDAGPVQQVAETIHILERGVGELEVFEMEFGLHQYQGGGDRSQGAV